MTKQVEAIFDPNTYTWTYIVYDKQTSDALVIDPVMDYDPASASVSENSAQKIIKFINEKKLNLKVILETHAHADHMSGAQILKKTYPTAKIGIGANITKVQELFKAHFNYETLAIDGSQFDLLLTEQEELSVGSIVVKTIFTPGHTPACSSYLIDDMLFCGDSLFLPDSGTGRCDFPAGDAQALYHSVHNKLYELPNETKVFVGHDYGPNGRDIQYLTTIGESKEKNIQLKAETSQVDFVKYRVERDKTLAAPKLLLPSVQVNIAAGCFPPAQEDGKSYLKIPLTKVN